MTHSGVPSPPDPDGFTLIHLEFNFSTKGKVLLLSHTPSKPHFPKYPTTWHPIVPLPPMQLELGSL